MFSFLSGFSSKKRRVFLRNINELIVFLLLVLNSAFLFPVLTLAQSSPPSHRSDLFSQAEYYFHAGDFLEARGLYNRFISEYPSDPNIPSALYKLGLLDFKAQSYRTALNYFELVLDNGRDPYLLHPAEFKSAQCHFYLEEWETARTRFRKIVQSHPDVNVRWEGILYLGKIDERRLDYENAVIKLVHVYRDSELPELKSEAKKRIEEVIEKKLTKEQMVSLIRIHSTGFPTDLLLLKLQSVYRNEGDRNNFQSTAEAFISQFPDQPEAEKLKEELKALRSNTKIGIKVGALLPLTGKYALTGQQVLQGIQLAWNQLESADQKKIFLEIKDTGDSPSISEKIKEMAADPFMVSILGPVFSNQVKEAAPIAESFKIPVFSPTASTPGLADLSPFIFRNALTKQNQAKYLAEYAVNELGLRRFVVLYPDKKYGIELKDDFVREVQSLGGQVVSMVSYDRNQTDFKEQILMIGGMTDNKLKKLSEQSLQNLERNRKKLKRVPLSEPRLEVENFDEDEIESMKISLQLNYDALFIPGLFDKVGLIVPQLVFYNIVDLTFLGANGWNSPELVKNAGRYLKKGYFVDGFFAQSDDLTVQRFVEDYRSTFAEEPNILSAQSYDAARILFQLIQRGSKNRKDIKERLFAVRDFPGVSGKTTILSSGESEKSLFSLIIQGNQIRQAQD